MDNDWYEKQLEKERLHSAASSGDIEQIKALLDEGLPINAFNSLNRTPLHCAAIGNQIEAVRYLIDAGADVNAHDEKSIGETPLGEVAANCTFDMAKVLVACRRESVSRIGPLEIWIDFRFERARLQSCRYCRKDDYRLQPPRDGFAVFDSTALLRILTISLRHATS